MKIFKNISKSIVVLLSLAVIMSACMDNSDPMEESISMLNENIQELDKTIASPGDIVTVTGKNLDKVFKIMLGDNVSIVPFEAKSSTTLEFTIPTSAPLGDVVVINFFFQKQGLAQRYIEIMSPPVVLGFSPIASLGNEPCKVMGAELYKAVDVYVGDVKVDFELIDDKNFIIQNLPTITDGDLIKIIDETGAEHLSQAGFVRATEILVVDFDSESDYYTSMSPNGNMTTATEVSGLPPYNKHYSFEFKDENTSWGGNLDLYFENISSEYDDNSKVWLYIDLKLSDNLKDNKKTRLMVEGPANVYGEDFLVTTEWQTFKVKLSDLYTGYGNGDEVGAAPIMANLKGVKIQPPLQAAESNFGKLLFVDNVRFIVEE